MNKKTFYISTPIYYPSGKPHVGHAFTTILGDVIAKYKALIGYETFFLTGTDEHGKKIEEGAAKLNMSTIDFVDMNVKVFVDLWEKLGVNYSKFIRTTNIQHIRTVQKVFTEYNNKGLIYLSDWKGKYCVSCEENILPKDIKIENGVECCSVGHPLTETSESSYFFKMSQFEDWIKEEFKKNPNWISPESRVNELTNNFLDAKLQDLSISRTSFSWGIQIVENPKHIMYVWLDALFNYITALDYLQPDDSLFQKFWANENAEVVHLLSKEITRFHCVYWPIFLHALGLRLPTKILSHGWIVTKTGKMSKSFGNVIDPIAICDEYGRDALRYYLIKDMSLVNDNIFTEETMVGTYNGDLANNVGNIISRTLGMLKKYTNSVIPSLSSNLDAKDKELLEAIKHLNTKAPEYINELAPAKVLEAVQDLINVANKYIEEKKPWELNKEGNIEAVNNLLNLLSNVVRVVFYWLQPVLVDGIKMASEQFNLDFSKISFEDINNLKALDNHQVGSSSPIYARRDIKSE